MQIVSFGNNLLGTSKIIFCPVFKVILMFRASCSKLTISLVNDSLKFTSSDMQIC